MAGPGKSGPPPKFGETMARRTVRLPVSLLERLEEEVRADRTLSDVIRERLERPAAVLEERASA